MKWIRYGLGAVLVVAAAAVVAFLAYRNAVLPLTDGTLALPGLKAELKIERDADGIPTIRAGNVEDLMFGLGVAHAQDRLWQMETHRRIGAGRLAEAFGEPALETDRFLRALAVRRTAAAQWAHMPAESRRLLEAYARGVNSVVHTLKARPPEFLILGLQPEDWDPVDSLAWTIMMAWDLGGNWGTELLRMRLALKLPVERINQLIPPYPGDQPLPTADYAALFRGLHLNATLAQQAMAGAPPSGVEGAGSNNWVVAGSHTASGKPLLANDPHLKLSAPALWYFARLEAPGIRMAGATMPGLPLVVLGQNDRVAWGFTNTGPDVQDLYLEQANPDDPSQYRTPDGWARFETHEEVIKVKGKPDVKFTVRSTRHGPVISDAGITDDVLGGAGARRPYSIAMQWTALDPQADLLSVGFQTTRAGSVQGYIDASRGYVAPMQNMVVADVEGHIGFVAAGKVPVRKPENDLKGLVPAPGWDARYDWAGYVPAEETPRETDPPRGWIATANQRIHAPDYPHYLTSEWAAPWRKQRIDQLLQARDKHTPESLAAMQADVQSLEAPKLLPWLLQAKSAHPLAAEAMKHLKGFDGTMAADRAAPLIFWAWSRHLAERVFADEVGSTLYERSLSSRSFRDALEEVLARNDAWWCDDKRTPAPETCAMLADRALTEALEELQARFGIDVAQWHWSDAHQARSEHRPFSKVKALARFFELRAPVGGDTFTINVSRVGLKPDPTTGELYLDEHGPSLRAIYDLGDPRQSRFMHSSGQSGIVLSPLYRSFVRRWANVEYVPLWAQGAPAHTLVLQPGAAR